MVLSSIASSDASSGCTAPEPHKYSMYSALVTGLSTLLISISLGIYIYKDDIGSYVQQGFNFKED